MSILAPPARVADPTTSLVAGSHETWPLKRQTNSPTGTYTSTTNLVPADRAAVLVHDIGIQIVRNAEGQVGLRVVEGSLCAFALGDIRRRADERAGLTGFAVGNATARFDPAYLGVCNCHAVLTPIVRPFVDGALARGSFASAIVLLLVKHKRSMDIDRFSDLKG